MLSGIHGRGESPGHLGKATLNVIHQIGAPPQPLQAKFPPRLIHSVIDGGSIGHRPVKLIGKVAGHPDPANLSRDAVDCRVTETQELNVS